MTMTEPLTLLLAWLAGGATGAAYFAGLWWTVSRGTSSRRPGWWFFASLMLRSALAMAAFYFVGGGDWQRLAACLLGFVMARMLALRWPTGAQEEAREEARRAA